MSDPDWKSRELPAVNSRWDRKLELGAGSRTARVMGVVEGYVVARFSGRMPFLTHMSDWHDAFEPKPMPPGGIPKSHSAARESALGRKADQYGSKLVETMRGMVPYEEAQRRAAEAMRQAADKLWPTK